jgi:RsmE family RNA methyltransferase
MSHLFITTWHEEGTVCILSDQSLIHQITRVLRMQTGDFFFLQDTAWTKRYEVVIEKIMPDQLLVKIKQKILPPKNKTSRTGLVLAMPNKFEKLELMVQKLTEIWVNEIICRPSRRSLLRELPDKKKSRLELIIREASEQSRWRHLPTLHFSTTFPVLEWADVLLFDYHEHLDLPVYPANNYKKSITGSILRWIIWQEGWFSPEEIDWWASALHAQISLGDQVLRMETAAIVAGRWMKQLQE